MEKTPKELARYLVELFTHSEISDKHQVEWAKMNATKALKFHTDNMNRETYRVDCFYWMDVYKEIQNINE